MTPGETSLGHPAPCASIITAKTRRALRLPAPCARRWKASPFGHSASNRADICALALPGYVSPPDEVIMCARDPALGGTFGVRRHERASTLTRPGSTLNSMTVRPWSSTRRVRQFVS